MLELSILAYVNIDIKNKETQNCIETKVVVSYT